MSKKPPGKPQGPQDPPKPIQPGVSPISGTRPPALPKDNPQGRSKEPDGPPAKAEDIDALCRLYAPEAIRILRRIMRNTHATPSARISAAMAIVDRAFGKVGVAEQFAKPKAIDRDLDQLSDDQIAAALRAIAHRKPAKAHTREEAH